jgi:predicted KAP-like P-loop ATPase
MEQSSRYATLPVIADVPSPSPGLGFQEYAEAIADAVRGGTPPQFTIGLYGAWGTGKSSLLNAIKTSLDKEDSVIPVRFDAWRYEKSEHIIVPLLYSIYSSIEKIKRPEITKQLGRAIDSIIYGLNFDLGVVGVGGRASVKDMVQRWEEKQALPQLEEAFAKPFDELRKLPEVLGERRIAVLIDDLDRCASEKVVSVLEAINLVMDLPGFIVLALYYDVLIESINSKYPYVSGHSFIQKMVQLPFRVPPSTWRNKNF